MVIKNCIYQIEFYELSDESSAIGFYQNKKQRKRGDINGTLE